MKSLFPHQEFILTKIKEREDSGLTSTIIDLICGSGKSLIISRLCKDSDKNNLIIVNKYSLNQWIDLFNKEEQLINVISSKNSNIDNRYKINLVLDEVYNYVVDTNIIYDRVIIDEVSGFIKKNITTTSIILLSYTYMELYKYKSYEQINLDSEFDDINLYDFYFGEEYDNYLIKEIQDYNNSIYCKFTINYIQLKQNKNYHINTILNKRSNVDKFIIFTNTINMISLEHLLESKLHKYLIINYDMKPEGLKKIQSTFSKNQYSILVINTDININGISFSNVNNIIFYTEVDEMQKMQCIGRVIRVTNKFSQISIYLP